MNHWALRVGDKVSHWASLEEKGTVLGIRFLVWVQRVFGRLPFLVVVYPVVLYYFLTSSVARRSSVSYLERVRRLRPLHENRSISVLSIIHFRVFAEGLLDKINAWVGGFGYDDVDFPDKTIFHELMDRQQGAIIIGSHYGNLEIMRALSTYNDRIRLNILVHTKHAEKFNRLLSMSGEPTGLRMIQVTEINPATAILLKTKIDAGEFVVIVGDRVPISARRGNPVLRTSRVDFMGDKARFSTGPHLLASLMKCPVYTLFCFRRDGRYKIEFKPFADKIQLQRSDRQASLDKYAQKYAAILEAVVLQEPLQWFNFFPFWDDAD